MKRVSVIILTCNQRDLTLRCLKSISPLISSENYEVIVVDNGSTDATEKEIAEKYPEINYIKLKENRGVAAARNIGLKAAAGCYLMILDNDTIAGEETIEALADYLDLNPDCGIVAPRLVSPLGDTQTSYKDFPGIGIKISNWIDKKRMGDIAASIPAGPIEPFYVIGAAQMFSAETFKKIGPLDENIFFGPEDADFCMRVRKAGKKVTYLPSVTIIHDWQRSTSGRKLNRRSLLHMKGLIYFYFKHRRFF